MKLPKKAPYGTWASPITADDLARSSKSLSSLRCDNGNIYWLEGRPEESGRQVIMCASSDKTIQTHTPDGYSVRSRVHEYGGGDYTVHQGVIYFSNDADQRLYRQDKGLNPLPLTPIPPKPHSLRYADSICTPDGRWLIAVRESHQEHEVLNELVVISTDARMSIKILSSGFDFYSSPQISPDGKRLAWICWNHPQMPWDGTELWLADLSPELELSHPKRIAGNASVSIAQPRWRSDGTLFFISDETNWWNIYQYDPHSTNDLDVARDYFNICPLEAECTTPPWIFGINTYAFIDTTRIMVITIKNAQQQLGIIHDKTYSPLAIPTDNFQPSVALQNGSAFFIGGSAISFFQLLEYLLDTHSLTVLYKNSDFSVDRHYISLPKAIEFPTDHHLTAYAFYYAPCNGDYMPLNTEKPPLLVIGHGGPTSMANSVLNLKIQYWTSRGFAVLDVNYGGSTGFGREYRNRLNKQWGIVDVADCINGAQYLVDQGQVDEKRLIFRGGSAGGYTALCALTFYDRFTAGCSYYGVADLVALVHDTHKFESHYLDTLIGSHPEEKSIYKDRSPIHHTDQLACPILFIQGLKDKVVPPSQAEAMISAMDKKNLAYAYLTFPTEGHGFREFKNIKSAIEAELYFYGQVFGFKPSDDLASIPIKNH